MKLSVLDLIGVRKGQTTGQALRASREMAEVADRLGYTRYWVAEHHNTASVASTTPAVELMYLGENTRQIRLGSGGVMLPNHSALAIAEQFALLAAVYGDRIDLGIGRAPGTDPITSAAIRGQLGGGHYVDSSGKPADPLRDFPKHVEDIRSLLSPCGAVFQLPLGRRYQLRPAPDVQHPPQIWLLGSSDYSAELAAELGLPYVFAHHFSGHGTERALALYRNGFRRAEGSPDIAPRTFVSVNVSVAETADEAWELAEPHMLAMAMLRTGGSLDRARFVGDDVRSVLTDDLRDLVAPMVSSWAIGDPDQVRDQLRETAERFGVDEIMVHPVQGAREGDPADSWPSRVRGLELLANALLSE
ncbi:MAG TPA: LLM class flavin-dependent oxidoreductase [Arachnia sp.]|nr:LLM class flavin-dependent oxidoreductase [Arachnia sp.]HMT87737.1 LLM class flavin-dependent oxidoreductase [Arachnia sp.]